MSNERITSDKYQAEIERIVRDALKKAGGDGIRALRARRIVWEVIDGHDWITSNDYHLQILEVASDPSYHLINMGEDLTAAFLEGGLSKVTQILAFCAMMCDAMEKLYDLLEEEEEADSTTLQQIV